MDILVLILLILFIFILFWPAEEQREITGHELINIINQENCKPHIWIKRPSENGQYLQCGKCGYRAGQDQ